MIEVPLFLPVNESHSLPFWFSQRNLHTLLKKILNYRKNYKLKKLKIED